MPEVLYEEIRVCTECGISFTQGTINAGAWKKKVTCNQTCSTKRGHRIAREKLAKKRVTVVIENILTEYTPEPPSPSIMKYVFYRRHIGTLGTLILWEGGE